MRLINILFLLLLIPAFSFGQDSISIIKSMMPFDDPKVQLQNLIRLSNHQIKKDLNAAEENAKKAINLARKLNDDFSQSRAAAFLGQVYTQKGNYKRAIDYFEQYLAGAERRGDSKAIANAYNRLGLVYNNMGKYDLAMEKFEAALVIWKKRNNPMLEAIVFSNIGYIYLLRQQHDQSIKYFENALDIRSSLALEWENDTMATQKGKEDNQRKISFLYTNLGEAYAGKKDPEKALNYYEKSLKIKDRQQLGITMVKTLVGMGNAYVQLGQHVTADTLYQKALHIARNQNSKSEELETLLSIGETHIKNDNLDIAQKHLLQCPKLAELSRSNTFHMRVNGSLSKLYAKKAQMDSAYKYEKLFSAFRDSVYTERSAETAAATANRFNLQVEQKKNEILRQNQKANQRLIIVLVIAALLAVAAAIAIYTGLRVKKKTFELLQKKNHEIQDKNLLLINQGAEIKRHSDQIELHNKQLRQSNEELEQFAYVASHDLREPLRTIRSYLQLLEKRYNDQLDQDGREFIEFASEGATRMDALLMDLLRYSRVGKEEVQKEEINLNKVVTRVSNSLNRQISESNSQIICGKLPRIIGHEIEMIQLFQNLISNGIKFQRSEFPIIEVKAAEQNGFHLISVRDNGIGIDEKYRQKVFTIFQRLNGRNEFSGTGIGLAICSKIVTNHGGKIWFESKPGEGTTFFFTLPKKLTTHSTYSEVPSKEKESENGNLHKHLKENIWL